jgi:translation initiation factor 4G
MKSVGNVKFIGELFKIGRLTTNIMQQYVKRLLKEEDEGSLECSCELLTTDGKGLENKNQGLSEHFNKIKRSLRKGGLQIGLDSCCGM